MISGSRKVQNSLILSQFAIGNNASGKKNLVQASLFLLDRATKTSKVCWLDIGIFDPCRYSVRLSNIWMHLRDPRNCLPNLPSFINIISFLRPLCSSNSQNSSALFHGLEQFSMATNLRAKCFVCDDKLFFTLLLSDIICNATFNFSLPICPSKLSWKQDKSLSYARHVCKLHQGMPGGGGGGGGGRGRWGKERKKTNF